MTLLNHIKTALALTTVLCSASAIAQITPPTQHNIILFVPDGLRAEIVNGTTAPNLDKIRRQGVFFRNSHSIFPTFTTANAAGLSTGHYPGDTGDYSNTIYTGYPQPFANGSVTPFLENDQVLSDVDDNFLGTLSDPSTETLINTGYLNEEAVLAAARAAGYMTAAVGKLGPVAIFDHQNSALVAANLRDTRGNGATIFIDDRTGASTGIPLDPATANALTALGISTTAPGRGTNGSSGNNVTPGTLVANASQQDYFISTITNVLLPRFKSSGKPFVIVFWSRDPDGTQHNQGDSLNRLVPGINGPTSLAAIANADNDIGRIRSALDVQGLTATTDIIVAADHGFSTVSKHSGRSFSNSATSFAATQTYQTFRSGVLAQEVNTGFLPSGFLAIDIAHGLNLPLRDPDSAPAGSPTPITPASYPPVDPTQPPLADGTRRQRPAFGNGIIGTDVNNPDVVVAANGGSDLVYLPNAVNRQALVAQVVNLLLNQDYIGGIFVDDALGSIPGTLPMSSINMKGTAITPMPAIVVNFRADSTLGAGCPFATSRLCATEVADTGLQEGQGMHGSFNRADTWNFMAAIGPDFNKAFVDPAPVSNADVGMTIASILGLRIPAKGTLAGRVMSEALVGGGPVPAFQRQLINSARASNGLRTTIDVMSIGNMNYFNSAQITGVPRVLGLRLKTN